MQMSMHNVYLQTVVKKKSTYLDTFPLLPTNDHTLHSERQQRDRDQVTETETSSTDSLVSLSVCKNNPHHVNMDEVNACPLICTHLFELERCHFMCASGIRKLKEYRRVFLRPYALVTADIIWRSVSVWLSSYTVFTR